MNKEIRLMVRFAEYKNGDGHFIHDLSFLKDKKIAEIVDSGEEEVILTVE
jgi:hypothetical protein